MGKWFPGIRKATPEQAREYREAHKALWRNPDREETPRYNQLNTTANRTCVPLSRTQQWWHFQLALAERDREAAAERRTARQGRGTR